MSVADLASMTDESLSAILVDKPPIQLAYFDIDGTILDVDGHYPQALSEELQRIQSLGVKTAIASGRPQFATQFLTEELKLTDIGVYCTGAQLYDPLVNRAVKEHYLEADDCLALAKRIRMTGVYHELYTSASFYIERDIAPDIRKVHAKHLRTNPEYGDFDEIIGEGGVIKFLIGADQSKDTSILKSLEQEFPHLHFAYACLPAYPQWLFASIISSGACKKAAFDELLVHHGITSSEVIAFGDAQSDMTFLERAGIGVAMGNAGKEVQAVADFFTKPVWEEGLPYALRRLVRPSFKR